MNGLRGRLDPGEGRVLVTMALATSTVEGVRPTASYRAIELGAGAFEIGIIAGAFATLAVFAAVPLGRAVDRLGERRFLVIGATLLAAAAAVGLSFPFVAALVVMQGLLGLGQVCMAISAQTHAGNSARGAGDHRFARLSVAVAVGHFTGPLLSGLIIDLGPTGPLGATTLTTLLVLGGLAVATLVLSTGVASSPPASTSDTELRRTGVGELLRIAGMPQAMYVGIAALTTLDLLIAYLPVVGEERGIPPSVIGYLLATRAAMTIASRLSMGVLLRAWGRRALLLGSMAVAGACMTGIAFGLPVAILFLLLAVAGFTLGVGMPMTTAWVSSRAPTGSRGLALAVRTTGNRLSQVVVPMSLGVVAAGFGAGAVFFASGAGLVVAAALVRTAPLGPER